jgi:hypothetical protein
MAVSGGGVVIPYAAGDGMQMVLPAGGLDDDPGVRPGAHGYVVAQAPWHTTTDTLPRFPTAPPSVVACPSPPVQRQTSPWQTAWIHGSCLCGGVVYEVSGQEKLTKCHRLGRLQTQEAVAILGL